MSQKNTDKAKPLAEDKANIMPVTDASSKDKPAEKKKRQALYSENLPTFYCGIGNNSDLIISIMKKLGWEQIFETTSDEYKLKWVQCTRSINWNSFREGDQMVNHIPNCSLFTNKLNLLCSLQAYEKTQLNNPNGHSLFMPLADYVPLTYKLDVPADKEAYFSTAKKDELWICKPVSMNQGKGIYLVRSPEMLKQRLDAAEDGQQKKFGGNKLTQRIIQKYIDNPLLVNRKKFDIRCYMTIASTKPILALFCHGYLRLTMNDFVHDDNNLLTHLTNQFFQKKDEKYKDEKETTTWSMDQFNTYINEHVAPQKNLPKDWVFNDLTKKMRNIMLQVVQSIRFKIQRKIGYFGIYGYDFMIDDNMKVWLIEVNVNPAITTNTEVLNVAIPPAVEEGIKLSIECFEKSKANKKLMPLSSLKNYTVIYNEGQVPCKKPRFDRSPSHVQARNPANAKSQANQINNSATKLSSPNYNKQSGSNSNVNNTDTNQNNVPKSAESSLISKSKSNISQLRNSHSSSLQNKTNGTASKGPTDFLPRASDISRLSEISNRNVKPITPYQIANATTNTSKAPLKTNVTSLSLKPATVEVYFRSNSGKAQKVNDIRKSVPTTIFPAPKIGLKS